jgi:hypothetical protein
MSTIVSAPSASAEATSVFRQRFCALSLIAAAALIIAGELTTPSGSTGSTEDQLNAFVEHPGLTQVSAVLFHFGYLLVLPGIVGLLRLTRLRGTRLANVGAGLAFVGFVSLAGNMLVDVFTLSAGQELGTKRAADYLDATGTLPGSLPFIIPAFLGSFLGLSLLFIAIGRAGELAWAWVAVTLVGLVLVFAAPVHVVTVIGFVAMSTGLAAAGARLLRG